MVIPSINCPDFETAKEQVRKAAEFLPADGWLHIDVSDGKFTQTRSWGDAEEFQSLGVTLHVEVHLMVEDPNAIVEQWLRAGAKRIIVHVQAARNLTELLALAHRYGAQVMLAFDPTQPVASAKLHARDISFLQVLTVFPGPSGQQKVPGWEERIAALREIFPTATIEVDGGMDPEAARIAKTAGADIIVAGHYIFGDPNPKEAYARLVAV